MSLRIPAFQIGDREIEEFQMGKDKGSPMKSVRKEISITREYLKQHFTAVTDLLG